MPKRNLTLIDEEVLFKDSEMFISRTDLRGVIKSGNDVFVRISGYKREDLFGRPHNIIRHPDMPKAVFKLFWSVIQAGQVIAAYVKNRAIDGRYYWVMALAIPIPNGYLSIRLKPRSPLFEVTKKIYQEMLKIEKTESVDASTLYLINQLKDHGYSSYEAFMFEVLKAEYKERDASSNISLKEEEPTHPTATQKTLLELKRSIDIATESFKTTIMELGKYGGIQSSCRQKSESISQSFSRLGDLSVNMSISAHKLGKEGGTLSVVANAFQSTAQQISNGFDRFSQQSQTMSTELNRVGLSVMCARIQIEMLSFFVGESIAKLSKVSPLEARTVEIQITQEMGELISALQSTFQSGSRFQSGFMDLVQKISKEATELRGLIARLDLIRTGGKLEGARTTKTYEIFRPFIRDMGEFVNRVSLPMGEIDKELGELCESYSELLGGTRLLEFTLSEVALLYNVVLKSTSPQELLATA